jgi:predicted dehydrogenase
MLEEMYSFCRMIKNSEEPATTAEDAKENLKVILAIKESAKTGKVIRIG